MHKFSADAQGGHKFSTDAQGKEQNLLKKISDDQDFTWKNALLLDWIRLR